MNFHSLGFLLLATLLTATAQAEQTCRSNLEQSTPTARYKLNDNGTVTDTETKITWMRCALGQKWDGKNCTGTAQNYSWQDAVDIVAEVNKERFAGLSAWRLPYVPELASIVERQCFDPRINLVVFPATPSVAFWTGMEKMGRPDQAYIIDFGGGAATPSKKTYQGPIRLMHDGPNGTWWKMPQK